MFEEFVFTWHTRAGSALPVEDIALSLRAGDFDPTSIPGAVTLDHVNDAVVSLYEDVRLKVRSVTTAEMAMRLLLLRFQPFMTPLSPASLASSLASPPLMSLLLTHITNMLMYHKNLDLDPQVCSSQSLLHCSTLIHARHLTVHSDFNKPPLASFQRQT